MCRVDISNFSQSQSAKIATSLDERWWNTSFFQSLNKGPCRYFSKQDSNNHSITNHDCLLSGWRLFLSLFDQWVFFLFLEKCTTPLLFSVPTPKPVKSPILQWYQVLWRFLLHTFNNQMEIQENRGQWTAKEITESYIKYLQLIFRCH